jgi:hypothetical protein
MSVRSSPGSGENPAFTLRTHTHLADAALGDAALLDDLVCRIPMALSALGSPSACGKLTREAVPASVTLIVDGGSIPSRSSTVATMSIRCACDREPDPAP